MKITKPNKLNDDFVKEELVADSMRTYRYQNDQVDLIFSNDTITLGCHVFPGINNLSSSKVHDTLSIIEKYNPNDQCESFSALSFKKQRIEQNNEMVRGYKYIFEKPAYLPKYLEYFRHPDNGEIKIQEAPPTLKCPGVSLITSPHIFLKAKGFHTCSLCSVVFCNTCGFVTSNLSKVVREKIYFKNKESDVCMMCYKKSSTSIFYSKSDDNDNFTSIKLGSLRIGSSEGTHAR